MHCLNSSNEIFLSKINFLSYSQTHKQYIEIYKCRKSPKHQHLFPTKNSSALMEELCFTPNSLVQLRAAS